MNAPRAARRLVLVAASLLMTGAASAEPSADAKPAAAGASTPALQPPVLSFKLLPSEGMPKLGGFRPQRLNLSADKPADLKKAPPMTSALYGQVPFGGRQYLLAVDEPDAGDAKLYVDSNGNGDLTDDPAAKWEKKQSDGPNGAKLTMYNGKFQLPLGGAADAPLVSLGAYRFDRNDPNRAQLKTTLLYYSDYVYEGDVTIAGAKHKALLADPSARGEFSAAAGPNAATLLIDRNDDGRFSGRSETFDASKPFNVGGATWSMAFPGDAGAPLKLAPSAEQVAEIPLPPKHTVGATITPFKATRMDGKPVDFPADYKGKLVMLDFWATWCGPCMMEVPGLVSAYNKHHPDGLEILGISLDQEKAEDAIKKVTSEKGMTWPQVYDGKAWDAEVAQRYGIEGIPAAYLVDGDTGEILAAGESLRGDQLDKTLQAALAKKTGKPTAGTSDAR
jgi:thiol-disulfide isomerase/thioredoxin